MTRAAPSLPELLAERIAAAGSISLMDYMGRANAHYYATRDPLGADGDFITAPEISQMFGEMIGLWCADQWMRSGKPAVHYVELGPGRGTLAADALRAGQKFGFAPNVHFVETSPALRALQSAAVPQAVHHNGIETLPHDGPMFIIANEFFDALPIRQVEMTAAGWRDRRVTQTGEDAATGYCIVHGDTDMAHAVPPLMRDAPLGSIYESAPAGAAILYELADRLARQGGAMLVIDYGHTRPGYGDTLQAVKAHGFASVFDHPGEHDLTAHVNFAELAVVAQAQGLQIAGPMTQGAFLTALGIEARAAVLSQGGGEAADMVAEALARLTHPDRMGDLFKAVAFYSEGWVVPEGLD
jgi:NADH dehydrogenase [ubiquinone] 1 alpha subcomplex assembly factor 7